MAHRIQIARAWCDECLANCWHAYDESTRTNEHLGDSNAKKWEELKAKGYIPKHIGGARIHLHTLESRAPCIAARMADRRREQRTRIHTRLVRKRVST